MKTPEIMVEVFGWGLFVGSFVFIWLGYYEPNIRIPLTLTYCAMLGWLIISILACDVEEKKENE